MIPIGSVSVGPLDQTVEVGQFSLGEDDDVLWVQVTQISPDQVWNFSYGLLWWENDFGRELGTEKVYGHQEGEIFRFGVGRAPRQRDGRLYFAPRAWNRQWISIETPPIWSLTFSGESGQSGFSPDVPAFGIRATLGVLADLGSYGITYAITDGLAKVKLN